MLQEQPFSTLETLLSYVICYQFLMQKKLPDLRPREFVLLSRSWQVRTTEDECQNFAYLRNALGLYRNVDFEGQS
ncbi:hypothetical protein PO909_016491 [Leuciscus waleckii]